MFTEGFGIERTRITSATDGSVGHWEREAVCTGGGGDLVLTMPGCVCPKVKDMGSFFTSRE